MGLYEAFFPYRRFTSYVFCKTFGKVGSKNVRIAGCNENEFLDLTPDVSKNVENRWNFDNLDFFSIGEI